MQRYSLERWAWITCAIGASVCALAAAWHVFELQSTLRFNQQLTTQHEAYSPLVKRKALDLQLKLVEASRLEEEGKSTQALGVLRDVESFTQGFSDKASTRLHAHAKFNSANIYLRQAIEQNSNGSRAKAVPPAELAKALYRDVLRQNPQAWDARYNLERALAIVPEADANEDEAMALPPPGERAVTTMRGVSPGMP